MTRRLRERDYILITDVMRDRYLQIGKVIKVQNYPHSDDIQLYRVQFIDSICEYDDSLEDKCRVLMFKS